MSRPYVSIFMQTLKTSNAKSVIFNFNTKFERKRVDWVRSHLCLLVYLLSRNWAGLNSNLQIEYVFVIYFSKIINFYHPAIRFFFFSFFFNLAA